MTGRRDLAESLIRDFEKTDDGRYVDPYYIGMIYLGLGENDRAFEHFERAYSERADAMAFLKVDPQLDDVRSDPRLANLIQRVGLPQ